MVPIQAVYGAISAESAGPQNGNASQALALALNSNPPGFAYTYAPGVTAVVEAQGGELQSVRLQFATSGIIAWTSRGELTWYYLDTAIGTGGRSPQSVETLEGSNFNIELGSALDLLLTPGEPIGGSVVVPNTNTRGTQKSSTVGMMYTDNLGDIGPDLLELDGIIRARQGTFVTRSGVTIRGCAYGMNGADGIVYVQPSDIGSGSDQIPSEPTEVTSNDLENHPSVFLRRTDNLRALEALNSYRDGYDIENPSPLVTIDGPEEIPNFGVLAIIRDPLYVAWRIVADGSRCDVLLKVPDADIGARRPRDLFVATIAPMLAEDGNLTAPLFVYDQVADSGAGTWTFYRRGLYRKMGYIESVQFLGAFDDSLAPIYGEVIEQGTGRPIGPGPG